MIDIATPEVGFELEAAVGRRILCVRHVDGSPLEIILDLQDGGEVRLVLQSGTSTPGHAVRLVPREDTLTAAVGHRSTIR